MGGAGRLDAASHPSTSLVTWYFALSVWSIAQTKNLYGNCTFSMSAKMKVVNPNLHGPAETKKKEYENINFFQLNWSSDLEKKVPGRTLKPILSVLDQQIGF